ncbi:hypothetical protein ACFZCL_01450 [Streptomyces sp. NPDC008159]|uniref:hypothetical protein n=1 Tax=Streptomyces sp. NPDC008159 TaxID=3364817 RepID=UPI0036EFFCA3
MGLAVSGDGNRVDVHGDVVVNDRARAPRSGYLLEVRQLAAPVFEGRTDELAAMHAFVTAPDAPAHGYWRWLAPAWSGKTALMAQFVLHPPPGTDVLAFFITARMAGRADRVAFLSALEEQLREYLHDGDVECSTQGAFLDALERATAQAAAEGRQLVLAVDGLDEDTGVTTASSGHSIAALLPRVPPPGLRIVVAGRPNPPVPGDVPAGHPLLSTGINHSLAASAVAQAVREDAERNLEALIADGGLGLELVGLIAAARGGLGAADIAELTGQSRRRIELVLGGSVGRAFQHRPAQWATDGAGEPTPLYSFAHQELLDSARGILAPADLAAYRERVHTYVDLARRAGWPTETAEYCLVGYPEMLREQQDTRRLTELATDPVRHERLWKTTGTDSEALTTIDDAMSLHRSAPDPDVISCVRLAQQRDLLRRKGATTPQGVITTWARVGQVRRAIAMTMYPKPEHELPHLLAAIVSAAAPAPEAVALVLAAARSVTDPRTRLRAWEEIADAMVASGLYDDAVELVRTVRADDLAARILGDVADRLAEAARYDEALPLALEAADCARAIPQADQRVRALGGALSPLARAGRVDEADALAQEAAEAARSITDPDWKARALADLAVARVRGGQLDEGVDLLRTLPGEHRSSASVLSRVAASLIAAGEHARAVRLVEELGGKADHDSIMAEAFTDLIVSSRGRGAVELTRSITEPHLRHRVTQMVEVRRNAGGKAWEDGTYTAELALEAADRARAEGDPAARASALADAADALARVGRHSTAAELAVEAADLARSVTDLHGREQAHRDTTDALARAGRHKAASDLASGITDPCLRAQAFRDTARSLLSTGQVDDAASLVGEAAEAAAAIVRTDLRAWALGEAAYLWALAGRYTAAADLARTITDSDGQAKALGAVAKALAYAGRYDEALDLGNSIVHPEWPARTLSEVAAAMARAGLYGKAVEVARAIFSRVQRARALLAIATAQVGAGLHDDAGGPAGEAADVASALADSALRDPTSANAAVVMSGAGRHDQAIALVHGIVDTNLRVRTLSDMAMTLTGMNHHLAVGLAQEATELALGITEPMAWNRFRAVRVAWYPRDRALGDAVEALARTGQFDRAVRIARSITADDRQSRALRDVSIAMAEAGRHEEAADLARALPERVQRALAVSALAALHDSSARRHALLAEALDSTAPGLLTQRLAAVEPAALEELARCVRSQP